MDIHISAEPVPGIGRRYELRVEADRNVSAPIGRGTWSSVEIPGSFANHDSLPDSGTDRIAA